MMTNAEFKNAVLTNSLSDSLYVLKLAPKSKELPAAPENSKFILDQYIDYYCKQQNLTKKYINSITETFVTTESIFGDEEERILNILEVEKLTEPIDEVTASKIRNTFIICNDILTKYEPIYGNYIVLLVQPTEDNILDYIKSECAGLSSSKEAEDKSINKVIKLFYKYTNGNIYKIQTELNKIKLFEDSKQLDVLKALLEDVNSDLYTIDFFGISSLLERFSKANVWENQEMCNFVIRGKNLNFDPVGLANNILGAYKRMIYTSPHSHKTASDLGISTYVFNKLRETGSRFTSNELSNKISFLTELDIKLKHSELDLTRDRMMDYLICKLAEI